MTAQATDSVLPVIERHLAAAVEHIREAQEDHGLEDRHPETAALLAELEQERGVPGGGE